ncbi:hypothetical protein F511_11029 [Dorcoceras hygrometricum]|uniref:Uncharacterized protein n=1 Tax=Dorcoceras hygrometricum TaxID=472368 RepID=A0A2Z7CI72_9LAMI|nr:hypothetical protein F511_11029 [Dorcoceras hygrometricum]
MSLFDLRDVCIVIGSLATLDLPMVVDLIGICVLKGPYCTLTMTDWFLQALSVIPRGSWGDVARRFTMIRWPITSLHMHGLGLMYDNTTHHKTLASKRRPPLSSTPLSAGRRLAAFPPQPPPFRRAAAACRYRTCSDHLVVEIPLVSNSSALLVQTDEGVLFPVVDRIRRSTAAYR